MKGQNAVIGGVICLTTVTAHAQPSPPVAEPCEETPDVCRVAPLVFDETTASPLEWSFDSGWVPPGSALQVRLQSLFAANTRVRLEGMAYTDWLVPERDEQLLFDLPGLPDGGLLEYHYGVAVLADGKVQINLSPFPSIGWQGPIPYVPQVDLQVEDSTVFDAWGWDPGVTSASSSQPQRVAQVDITQLLGVNVPGLEGGFELDVAVDLEVSWTNHRLVIERVVDGVPQQPVDGGPITAAGELSHDAIPRGGFMEVDVHPEGTVRYAGTLHLIPGLYVKALGNTWTMPLVNIPAPIAPTEVEWSFSPQRVHIPLPDLHVADEVIDFGEVVVGASVERDVQAQNDGEARVVAAGTTSLPAVFSAEAGELIIGPAESLTMAVTFSPQREGLQEATLLLASNDPDEPEQLVKLRGYGRASGDGYAPPPPAVEPDPVVIAEGGCGCRLVRSEDTSGHQAPWLIGALGLISYRRRSRRRRPSR